MMTAKKLLKLLIKKNPKKEILGIRGLTKVGESEYNFRYTYRDGDYVSLSDLMYLNTSEESEKKVVCKRIKQAQNG